MTDKERAIIDTVTNHVKNHTIADVAAHDWYHIQRVTATAEHLSDKIPCSKFVVILTALLHDVFDHKFYPGAIIRDEICNLLDKLGVIGDLLPTELENLIHTIENMSFKGGFNQVQLSIEGQVVQDADRLDAIGAIAIARTFAYGGKKDRLLYDPEQGVTALESEAHYLANTEHSINHFYVKLLKLKELLNTEPAKVIAERRHQFMEQYLEQFFTEWEGRDLIEGQ